MKSSSSSKGSLRQQMNMFAPPVQKLWNDLLDRIEEFHQANGSEVLVGRGRNRRVIPVADASSFAIEAEWFDFLHVGKARYQPNQRRFITIPIQVKPRMNNGFSFGVSDDTGYMFACLQQYIPRACFMVYDCVEQTAWIVHGNKKFAGQGDEAAQEEEGTTAKFFPNTQHLEPHYYLFTWKANGKNAGVIAHTDPKTGQRWLFVNTKGVMECVGLVETVLNKDSTTSETLLLQSLKNNHIDSSTTTSVLIASILESFRTIWNHPGLRQERILDLWDQGYLILFEYCDNQHIVLEEGPKSNQHLAFIGLVKQPVRQSSDTYSSGMVYQVDGQFTFDIWYQVNPPLYTCKPVVRVAVDQLDLALQHVMQGIFYRKRQVSDENPSSSQSSSSLGSFIQTFDPNSTTPPLSGEGAVCYEMALAKEDTSANNSSQKQTPVIRQLFKAKTASYIVHRMFRGFLSRKHNQDYTVNFGEMYNRVHLFCRQRFGELSEEPYPDLDTFCKEPSKTILAASLFYSHFSMWLLDLAAKLHTKPSILVGCSVDVASFSAATKEAILQQNYMDESDTHNVLQDQANKNDLTTNQTICQAGFAMRMAEFCAQFRLQPSCMFSNPNEMLERIRELEDEGKAFLWKTMPSGYNSNSIIEIGFNIAFPGGVAPKKKDKKRPKKDKVGILAPFRTALSTFLSLNPEVKLTVGSRDHLPNYFVFSSSDDHMTHVKSKTLEDFIDKLQKLPDLSHPWHHPDQSGDGDPRVLCKGAAIDLATRALQPFCDGDNGLLPTFSQLSIGDVECHYVPLDTATVQDLTSKQLLILRGFPGLGKSTIGKAFQRILGAEKVAVIEADSFFGPNCPYHPSLLTAAHSDARSRAVKALGDPNIVLVIIANTNTTAREYAPYIQMAMDSEWCKVGILTLDTQTNIEQIENVHSVPLDKVQQMAFRLRHPDNNPNGKAVDELLEIAKRQELDYRSIPAPVLVWGRLDTKGEKLIDTVWKEFCVFAAKEKIQIDAITRPVNLHATQLYLRPSDSYEKFSKLFDAWDYHGTSQTLVLGDVRYKVEPRSADDEWTFDLVNLAIQVESFSPHIIHKETPHITIAYDKRFASASDSNNLWLDCEHEKTRIWRNESHGRSIMAIIESGSFQANQITHQIPHWVASKQEEVRQESMHAQLS